MSIFKKNEINIYDERMQMMDEDLKNLGNRIRNKSYEVYITTQAYDVYVQGDNEYHNVMQNAVELVKQELMELMEQYNKMCDEREEYHEKNREHMSQYWGKAYAPYVYVELGIKDVFR